MDIFSLTLHYEIRVFMGHREEMGKIVAKSYLQNLCEVSSSMSLRYRIIYSSVACWLHGVNKFPESLQAELFPLKVLV